MKHLKLFVFYLRTSGSAHDIKGLCISRGQWPAKKQPKPIKRLLFPTYMKLLNGIEPLEYYNVNNVPAMTAFIQCNSYVDNINNVNCKSAQYFQQGGRGHWVIFITLVPKVLQKSFLICQLNNFGDQCNKFRFFVLLSSMSKHFNNKV